MCILDHEYNTSDELLNLRICEIKNNNTHWSLPFVPANSWPLTPVLDTGLLKSMGFPGLWEAPLF